MKKYFENFNFNNFWDGDDLPEYKPTLEDIKKVEEKLEIKLPDSYKEFIQIQN
jgi:cell wall assembly regulator SMI1